jgi:hypothetical protein
VRKNILAVLFLAFCPLLVAQQALNNDSVIKLIKAGQSSDQIVSNIDDLPGIYDTSVDAQTALKAAGASDTVIAAILRKAAGPGATTASSSAASQKQISLCEFQVNGSTKAGNAGAALGPISPIAGAVVAANGTLSYYPSINKEVQHIYETALKASGLFQYTDREKLIGREGDTPLPLADTAAKNKLFACVSAKPFWNNRMGFNKQLNITTKWEIEGPGGCKVKFSSNVATKETYGKFPNGADPALKSAYLELSKEDAEQFLAAYEKAMKKAGCGE